MNKVRSIVPRCGWYFCVVAVVFGICSVTPAFGQTAKQLQQRRKLELEAKKRAFDRRNRSSSTSTTSRSTTSRSGSTSTSRSSASNPRTSSVTEPLPPLKYSIPPKTIMPYLFVLTAKGRGVTTHSGGIAVFEVVKHDRDSIHLKAKDNLRLSFDPTSTPSQPTSHSMIPKELHLDMDGFSPKVEGKLPHMMGIPHKWFFPRIPSRDKVGGGGTATRGFGSRASKDTGNADRAYFSWQVKLAKRRGRMASFTDTRFFETEDGATRHLKGAGNFQFDEKRGLVKRDFRATFRHYDAKYDISLKIRLLSSAQFQQLASK